MAKTNKRRDAERRSSAARKVEEMRRAQQAADRRKRIVLISAVVAAALVAVVLISVYANKQSAEPTAPSTAVAGTTPQYGVRVGQQGAPVHVVVYEDFLCPFCKEFEATSAATLKQYVANKTIDVEYRPIAFLDANSTTQYSTRSLNAAACVTARGGSEAFLQFHDLLYANQPAEGSAGLPDSQLIQYAAQAGASGPDVESCITDDRYSSWAAGATDAASKAGVNGTPTVFINDQPFSDIQSKDALVSAIRSAASAGQ